MNKGNLENLLGGTFTALPGLNGEVESDIDHELQIPGVNASEKVFEKSFDDEILENTRKHAPKYNPLSGRFDPFDYERMKHSAGTWSVLIDKPVITFADACEHALALCRLWVQEDGELAKIAVKREQIKVDKEVSSETNILIEGTKEYEVEQLRLAWRAAVKQKNEVMKQWTDYVDGLRTTYRNLRDN